MAYTSKPLNKAIDSHNTVLDADDDAVILSMLMDKLQFKGYRVISASDGEQALELIKENQPRVVVLDWIMPKLDGLSICRQVRSDSRLSHIRVIVLTARGQDSDLLEAQEAGADLILIKPVSLRVLVQHINSFFLDASLQTNGHLENQKRT